MVSFRPSICKEALPGQIRKLSNGRSQRSAQDLRSKDAVEDHPLIPQELEDAPDIQVVQYRQSRQRPAAQQGEDPPFSPTAGEKSLRRRTGQRQPHAKSKPDCAQVMTYDIPQHHQAHE